MYSECIREHQNGIIFPKICAGIPPISKYEAIPTTHMFSTTRSTNHSRNIQNAEIEIDLMHPKESSPSLLPLEFVFKLCEIGVTVKNIPKQFHKPVKGYELEFF